MYDMPAVKEKKLIALLLEEALPAGCVVEGVDFSAPEDESTTSSTVPDFVQRYEDIALGDQRERDALIANDRRLIAIDSGASSAPADRSVTDKPTDKKKMLS